MKKTEFLKLVSSLVTMMSLWAAKEKGQRSFRLSKAYRGFYIEHNGNIIIEVIEVNKHEY